MPSPRKVVVDIVGDAKGYSKATDDAVKASETLADKLKKAGGEAKKGFLEGIGIGGGLGVYDTVTKVIGGVVDSIGKSIDLASNKAEAASKANVLFGASYGIVERASRSAATSVGLSSGAYLEAAGDLGNLITNLGIAGDEAANMSVDMLQLASDMGSFNNASTQDVTEAMGAAFRGETEPIRRFGVMLSAAKVEAKAMAMGLKEGKQPLTDQAKAMATYQLILEQTTAAQGDFARTADGKANADRIRAAKSEEAFTRLGEVLVPLYQKAMPLLADATTLAIDVFSNLAGAVAPLVNGALGAIAGAIDTVGDSFTALKTLMDPGGAEWDRTTAAIMEQAKALGLNGEEVIAYTDALKRRRQAEAEAARTAAKVAEQDQIIADITANAQKELESYYTAIDNGASVEEYNLIIMERKRQLNSQLNPFLMERDRLLGVLREQQTAVNEVDAESVRIQGLAGDALAEYQKHLEYVAKVQEAAAIIYGRTTTAVEGQTAVFSKAASELNLGYGSVLLGTVEAQKKAAKALGPDAPQGVARAVENTVDSMFMSLSEAKGPWKEQWQKMAAWAKDPFSPEKFEDWVATRVAKAMKKARESFGAERKRWERIADAYRWIAKNNWIDPMNADIALIMVALRTASLGTKLANRTDAPPPNTGHNASGTSNWRGGPTWVGEQGPELIDLPRGSRVWSNAQSRQMAGGSGGGGNTTIINVTAGVGDPVAIGREVTRALRAYGQAGGVPAMKAALGG